MLCMAGHKIDSFDGLLDVVRVLVRGHHAAHEVRKIRVLGVCEVALANQLRAHLVDVPLIAFLVSRRIRCDPDFPAVAREDWCKAGAERADEADHRNDFLDAGQVVLPELLFRVPCLSTAHDRRFFLRLGGAPIEPADLDQRHQVPHRERVRDASLHDRLGELVESDAGYESTRFSCLDKVFRCFRGAVGFSLFGEDDAVVAAGAEKSGHAVVEDADENVAMLHFAHGDFFQIPCPEGFTELRRGRAAIAIAVRLIHRHQNFDLADELLILNASGEYRVDTCHHLRDSFFDKRLLTCEATEQSSDFLLM